MTTCTVWVPRAQDVPLNLRADAEELARMCVRNEAREAELLALVSQRSDRSAASARTALTHLSQVFAEGKTVRCSRCGLSFEAYRKAGGSWARQCRQCTVRGRNRIRNRRRER